MKNLSALQLILLSTGGMIGAGWLFSPYYGFQIAGFWVVFSWVFAAIMMCFIGLSFAEVANFLPIVGGSSRFMGITHNKASSFIFLVLGWLGYVVYLPLEVQSGIQYLGFWFHDLVIINPTSGVTLSYKGLWLALVVMLFLTWFNGLFIGKVAKANSFISVWKILIPLGIAWGLIISFGSLQNVNMVLTTHRFSFESILLAITSTGIAFAFTGFQNGIILANNTTKHSSNSITYSLFMPLLIGFLLYCSLSLAFIFCLGAVTLNITATAPLLGLVGLFSIHIVLVILFIDAVMAPLGTANVYTAVTARILLSIARDFLPKSVLVKLNKHMVPSVCLWVNCIIGACFLLPFPTWQQMINFLSSIVIFTYLAGPVTLIILRKDFSNLERRFSVSNYKLVGYIGFSCCGLLIYWSGLKNLIYLIGLVFFILSLYWIMINRASSLWSYIWKNLFLYGYLCGLAFIAYLHKANIIVFPLDNLLVILISAIFLRFFISNQLSITQINDNIAKYKQELNQEC